jgi:glycerol kinase
VRYVLALDQGTTSSRAILFDEEGNAVRVAQREIRQIYPQPGWVEHDPKEILATQCEVAREAVVAAGIKLEDLAAVGIANQRETTIVWDRQTGEPLHNAIVWQDRRTASLCDELRKAGAGDMVRERTGLVIDPYFSGTKIAWLLDHVPGARARAERGEFAFGTVDTWLIWHLTGNRTHVTDASNASRTLLYNIHTGEWDPELLNLLAVPRALLPDVRQLIARFRHAVPRHSGRGGNYRWRRGRPTGGVVRPGLPQAGHGEEHLRYRLFHAASHGRPGGAIAERPCNDVMRSNGRQGIRARRQRVCGRRRSAMAEGRNEVFFFLY